MGTATVQPTIPRVAVRGLVATLLGVVAVAQLAPVPAVAAPGTDVVEEVAPDPARIRELRSRFDAALDRYRETAVRAAQAETQLAGARDRAADAEADAGDLGPLASALRRGAADAARLVSRRAAALATAEHAALEIRTAVALARDVTAGHAAAIYKHGPTEVGAVESLLRTGSPSRFLVHRKMQEAILETDHGRVAVLTAGLAERESEVRRHERLLEAAGRTADEAAATAALVDDLAIVLDATAQAAGGGVATAEGRVARLAAQHAASVAGVDDMTARLTRLSPDLAEDLRAARRHVDGQVQAELDATLPFRGRSVSRPAVIPDVLGYACPVDGGSFVNDWRFPRKGGRTHQGTDVFAARGAPVRAVAAGTVVTVDTVDTHKAGGVAGDLGGITVTVATPAGEKWYYAHLGAVDPAVALGDTVASGQRVGTVGDSGNARGGAPHLHLGRSVGGVAANPFPALFVACSGSGPKVAERSGSGTHPF